MSRQAKVEAPEWPAEVPKQTEEWTLQLKVITPMFGGGYKSREVDPVNIIRPAAIRGHLRFWWRATAGARYDSLEEMFHAERMLWGGAVEKGKEKECVGQVAIKVTISDTGGSKKYSEIAPKSTPQQGPLTGYFMFPFQEQKGDTPAPEASGRVNVQFRLVVKLSTTLSDSESQKNEVRRAIQAWIAFGGVGARTRRGCGALQVVGGDAHQWMPPADRNARKSWFEQLIVSEQRQPRWTALAGVHVIIGSAKTDAMQIWSELAKFWARFRKGHVGSIQYSPMSGAKWRDYRKELLPFSKNPTDYVRLAKPFLGLPIIYQKFTNAPYAPTIESESSGRMSSPVILKPLALANGQFVPIVAVMSAPSPNKIKVKEGANVREVSLLPPDRQKDPVMKELQATTALEAVVVAAKRHVGQEEIRLGGGA